MLDKLRATLATVCARTGLRVVVMTTNVCRSSQMASVRSVYVYALRSYFPVMWSNTIILSSDSQAGASVGFKFWGAAAELDTGRVHPRVRSGRFGFGRVGSQKYVFHPSSKNPIHVQFIRKKPIIRYSYKKL